MKAQLNGVRISPKKTNIVAGLVRGKSVVDALNILKFTPKKASAHLYKAIASAAANAEENDGKSRDTLMVESIIINKGPVMKRFLPSTRGRALPLAKPTTHIKVFLQTQ